MSLRDLLPPGVYEDLVTQTQHQSKVTLQVCCPQCGKSIKYSPDNPYRPFCSERCKLIDLGDWAQEKHKIPGPTLIEDEDGFDPSGVDYEPNQDKTK